MSTPIPESVRRLYDIAAACGACPDCTADLRIERKALGDNAYAWRVVVLHDDTCPVLAQVVA